MKTLRLYIASLLLASIGSVVFPCTAIAQNTSQVHSLSGPYIEWFYSSGFTTLETDLKFVADPGTSSRWFLSHQFGLDDANGNNVSGGYIGLQTNTTTLDKKGVMFSIWNATAATPGNGATCQPFDGEGVGMQCFIAYPWVAGKTYRLRVVSNRGVGFSGYVLDMSTATPTVTYIGQIQAPAGVAAFGRSSTQWAEHYIGAPANCADFPYVKVLWSRPKGDSGAIAASNPNIIYDAGGYCKNTAIIASGFDYLMEAGNPGTSTRQNLASSSGKYLHPVMTNNACGGSGMKADSADITWCTAITRVALPGGKVALQSENGYYFSCANGGGGTVAATARTIGNHETFTETSSYGKLSYKSYGGKYLTAASYGSLDLYCNGYYAGTAEKFTPVVNKARSASVSVSSESISTSQLGIKATDGSTAGYPQDYAREWVTNGQGAGSWIQLTWSTATAVKQVLLYDRPNLNDQVLAGTLLFSDGSSVAVGALPNNGAALKISFASKNVSWVKFLVDQSAGLIGLAEIEVY